MAKVTHLGSLPPDDPICKTGLVIGAKRSAVLATGRLDAFGNQPAHASALDNDV